MGNGHGAGLVSTRPEAAGLLTRPARRLPYAVPDVVLRACAAEDWEAELPPAARRPGWRAQLVIKRALDVAGALLGLVLLSPLLLLIAVLVRVTSPGPILHRLEHLGLRGRPFIGYKFRTMVPDADALKARLLAHNEMSGPVFKMRRDPRVTRLGAFLRKYSLDELPQLWNVLWGDLSLVGPRAPMASEFARFQPWQRAKLAVKPGLTCLWQIGGRSRIKDFDRWVRLDLEYIQNWSLGLDIRILLQTIPAVLRGDGAY